ncbi:MAG: amidohydrolase family protein [Kiritimatiellae bacterium]|nr:amidohydrolase family protein [Kiritimatiellia bacterium]
MTTLIHGGVVVDGAGNPPCRADVLVENDKIAGVYPEGLDKTSNYFDSVISAEGLLVTPGFIDSHSHSDAYLVLEPEANSKITQGITTEINGQCGASIAPRYGQARLSSDWAALLGKRLTWRTLAEYKEVFSSSRPAINSIQFTGHNTIRSSVVGYDARQCSPDELKRMCYLFEETLEQGSWGLSTGLVYPPGKYSTPFEVETLAKIAASKGAFYATHMRSEADKIIESIDEVLSLVNATGVRAEISHLKTYGENNWHLIDRVLEKIGKAVELGELLGADRYPYTAACTELDIVIEDDGSIKDRDWSSVIVAGTWELENKRFSGRSVKDCADEHSVSPQDFIRQITARDKGKTGAFFFMMSQENLDRILSASWVVPGSDASLRRIDGPLGQDYPHPRAYGTMPVFYRRLRRLGFTIEQCVNRMTLAPALRFGIKGRGEIKKGAYADIAIWNEKEFAATSQFANPHSYASGMSYVLVNGVVSTFTNQSSSIGRGGRFLERN